MTVWRFERYLRNIQLTYDPRIRLTCCRKETIYFIKVDLTQWPRGLRRGSAAARLLGLRVLIPPVAWTSVSYACCVLASRDLCDVPTPLPEKSYRLCVSPSVISCNNPYTDTERVEGARLWNKEKFAGRVGKSKVCFNGTRCIIKNTNNEKSILFN